ETPAEGGSVFAAPAFFPQRRLDRVPVEAAAHEQRVETLSAHARIEPRVAPRRLCDHAPGTRRLVLLALALFQEPASRGYVIGRHAAGAQVLFEPAAPRRAPAGGGSEKGARVLAVVHQAALGEPLDHLLDGRGGVALLAQTPGEVGARAARALEQLERRLARGGGIDGTLFGERGAGTPAKAHLGASRARARRRDPPA